MIKHLKSITGLIKQSFMWSFFDYCSNPTFKDNGPDLLCTDMLRTEKEWLLRTSNLQHYVTITSLHKKLLVSQYIDILRIPFPNKCYVVQVVRVILAEVIISLHKLVNSVLASEQIIYIPFHFFMINKCLALSDSSLIHYQHRNDVDNLFLRVCAVLLIKNWRKITTHRTLACALVKSWHGHFLNDSHSKSS